MSMKRHVPNTTKKKMTNDITNTVKEKILSM